MQFFSLTPITLNLAAADHQGGRRPRADSVVMDEQSENRNLVIKMALHFPRRQGQPTQGADTLQKSIGQVSVLPSGDLF